MKTSEIIEQCRQQLWKLQKGDIIPFREAKEKNGHITIKIGLKEKQPDGTFKIMGD